MLFLNQISFLNLGNINLRYLVIFKVFKDNKKIKENTKLIFFNRYDLIN